MTSAVVTENLTKRYGRRTALADCTLDIPAGHVVGLVGPNGAGKSTLLQMICGLLQPTAGRLSVLGGAPVSGSARIGFVAQDTPVYAGLTIEEHLRFGAHLNPSWDAAIARDRIDALGLDPTQKAGKLSGGQRAQLALTVAIAKRPDLLLLDEPVAALDPLARREFLQGLMEYAAEAGTSVVMSSHLVTDLERVCDHLIVLNHGRVTLTGDIDTLLAEHRLLVGPRTATDLDRAGTVVEAVHSDRHTTLLVRDGAITTAPGWQAQPVALEDLVLAYLRRPSEPSAAVTSGVAA